MNNAPFGYKNLDNVGAFFNEIILDPTLRVSQFLDTNYKTWRASNIISAITLIKNSNFDYGYNSNGDNLLTGVSVANQTNINSALFVSYATRIYDIKTGGCISDYDSAMLYEKNAQVRYGDTLYISMQNNNTGNTPSSVSSFWSQITTSQYLGRNSILSNNSVSPNTKIDYTLVDLLFSDGSFKTLNAGNVDLAINGLGGLDTGTRQANSWYYLYGIYNQSTNVTGVIASLSAPNFTTKEYTGSSLPSGFTKSRYINNSAFYINNSSNIIPFTKYGMYTEYKTPISEPGGVLSGTQTHNITVPRIPVLVSVSMYSQQGSGQVLVRVSLYGNNASTTSGLDGSNNYLYGNWQSDLSIQKFILSTNAQIKSTSVYGAGSSSSFLLSTFGYFEL